MRAFQQARGLVETAECDAGTWQALVEATWKLGDRHLYLRSPMLRGDDIADLQRRLGVFGFDAGRIDGIYGPDTQRALSEFQRNVALNPDGICGHETYRALRRLSPRTATGHGIAAVREGMTLRDNVAVVDARLMIGHEQACGPLARHVARHLRHCGADVVTTDHPEASHQAVEANRFDARLFLSLDTRVPECVAFYGVPGFESVGGRQLAENLVEQLASCAFALPEARPMRLPILRETRMPAVAVSLGVVPPVRTVEVAAALGCAVEHWFSTKLH